MHVVIFEGSRWPTFAPVSLSRPVFCLASGMSSLLNKQLRYLEPTRLTLWVRAGLVDYCRRHVVPNLKVPTEINTPLDDEPALLVSGRTLHFGKYEVPRSPASCPTTTASALPTRIPRLGAARCNEPQRRLDEAL